MGAAGLVMAIVGGAAVPPLTGVLSDALSLRVAYAVVPTLCFAVVSAFAWRHARGAFDERGEASSLIRQRGDKPVPPVVPPQRELKDVLPLKS